MPNAVIDIHCHPGSLPYARSFSTEMRGRNSDDMRHENCIWHYQPPGQWEILIQQTTSVCKYTQSDFTTLAKGNYKIICASLHTPERGFVNYNWFGSNWAADALINFVTSFGKERTDFIQRNEDYFSDLEDEYNFYLQLNGRVIDVGYTKRRYVLVADSTKLPATLNTIDNGIETIYVIMTIEGMHNLQGTSNYSDFEMSVMQNLVKLKAWDYRPFFVTFAHHFYNGLCGHAESLNGRLRDALTNQEQNMNSKFTPFGWKVLKELIDDHHGRRIYIDIKHMSYAARREYINFLKTEHKDEYERGELPIIISHGACNGRMSADDKRPTPGLEITGSRMFTGEINFYDEEIVDLAKSGGIMGLQLDERVIASKKFKQSLRLILASSFQRKVSNSKMVWNTIEHIVRLLDRNNLFAWDCIAIGSDYGGVIDPINMFWSAEQMNELYEIIKTHADRFLTRNGAHFRLPGNKISAEEAVDRIFHQNAFNFIKRYFNQAPAKNC